ncbi:MAG: hypothetical protein KAT93_06975 [Desulfuromonadales bacterium]|nr:hypothetical protein [Desulfuromonadales bacterium]
MGQQELKRALVREAEERIRSLWADAEDEIAALRNKVAEQNKAADADAAKERQDALATLRAESWQRSVATERRAGLDAETLVLARLLALAGELLPALVADDREGWFAALADELPEYAWEEVRVHPDDVPHAAKAFVKAEVVADDTIAGGLIVSGDAGRIRVDNRLAKRLERLWPDLLPQLIDEVRKKESLDDAVPPETTS